MLHERGLATAVGDEGGFAPDLPSSEAAIEAILEAADRAGLRDRVAIALDPATSEVYRDGAYRFEGRELDADELSAFWADLVGRYPIVSIEDGAAEDDWDALDAADARARRPVQLVGDDLFVTNPERLRRGIDERRRQLDPGQGEPDRHADRDARGDRGSRSDAGYTAVMSHRSGETEDTTIADLAVATNAGQIKTGAPGALGSRREVQPAAADRGGARRAGPCIPAGRRSRGPDAPLGRGRWRSWTARSDGRRSSPRSGPRSATHEMVRALAEAGMDAARLNFSHGTHEEHAARAAHRARRAGRARPAARADRRPPGAEAPHRRARRAAHCCVAGETVVIAGGDRARTGDLSSRRP